MIAKKALAYIFLALISVCIFSVGFMPKAIYEPKVVYQVYLDGKAIGLINDKEELTKDIHTEQVKIKKEYNVSKVYAPEGLEIKKIITHNNDIYSAKEIYEKIKDLDSFTIDGYIITIKNNKESKKIYVLDDDIFKTAIDKTIKTFVDETEYELYLNSKQEEIETTGTFIENIYIEEDIVIEKSNISINKEIITNVDDLTKYLIYNTTETQATYTVSEEDTIENIAFNNKLSVEEFLIANSEFSSASVILLAGQVVNIGYINPQVNIVKKVYSVEDEIKKYGTEIIYDDTIVKGKSFVQQEGSDGLNRVTKRIEYVNGEATDVEILGTEELVPTVSKIVVKGNKYIPNVGIDGYWFWPTRRPFVITSGYGYRWGGQWHPAIDIAGWANGSPIYAANNGTVTIVKNGWNGGRGNYLVINHNNGYYTLYEHLIKIYVQAGEVVSRGQEIAGMGNTGRVIGNPGTHLHFEMWYGDPFGGGQDLNPLKYY